MGEKMHASTGEYKAKLVEDSTTIHSLLYTTEPSFAMHEAEFVT
jgi:hypothetical protein